MKEDNEKTPNEWRRDEFTSSTEPERVDLAFVHSFLSRSYWAKKFRLKLSGVRLKIHYASDFLKWKNKSDSPELFPIARHSPTFATFL